MSGTTLPTSAQPSHALSNIIDHPGSSWAAAGVIGVAVSNVVAANSLPTTAMGWASLIVSIAVAVMAALGK